MSEAPERIWADPDHWVEGQVLSDLARQGYTEYIRADHVDALLKAARAENEKLRAIALDYRHVLHSAKAGRDLYCGMYVAKEYHFTRDQIDAELLKIEQASAQIDAVDKYLSESKESQSDAVEN